MGHIGDYNIIPLVRLRSQLDRIHAFVDYYDNVKPPSQALSVTHLIYCKFTSGVWK